MNKITIKNKAWYDEQTRKLNTLTRELRAFDPIKKAIDMKEAYDLACEIVMKQIEKVLYEERINMFLHGFGGVKVDSNLKGVSYIHHLDMITNEGNLTVRKPNSINLGGFMYGE